MSMVRAKCSWVALSLFVLIGLSQTALAEKGFTDLEGEAAQFSDHRQRSGVCVCECVGGEVRRHLYVERKKEHGR